MIKALFFIIYASSSAWLTFFYIYLKEGAALNGIEIGIIAGFQQFNTLIVLPVWGIWADRFGRKRMLIIALFFSALLILLFPFLKGAASIILLVILITLVYNPINPLIDTIALDYQEQTNGTTSYGEIRMWGSFGWGSAALLSGIFINMTRLELIFPVSSTLFILSWIMLLVLYNPKRIRRNINRLRKSILREVLFEKKILLSFFSLVFFYSLFSAPVYLLINVYYNEIGSSTRILGIAYLVQGISELPFFFFGKKMVNRFGAGTLFIATVLFTAFRLLAYGFNNSPQLAIFIGSLHGISIGLFFVSVTAYVHDHVPAELRGTGQSLVHTFYAVGVGIGNVLSGILMDIFNMKHVMSMNAAGMFLLLLFIFFSGQSRNHTQKV